MNEPAMENAVGRVLGNKMRAFKDPAVLDKGAEAILLEGTWMGLAAICKARLRKEYRHPALDERIRGERTVSEARILHALFLKDFPVPCLLEVDLDVPCIVMTRAEGVKAKDAIERGELDGGALSRLFHEIGATVARLHDTGYVHGDLTTSNIIVDMDSPPDEGCFPFTLIDLGLAMHTTSMEDRGVDVHLLSRVVTSTHAEKKELILDTFLDGYNTWMSGEEKEEEYVQMVRRVKAIESRGRYVDKKKRT